MRPMRSRPFTVLGALVVSLTLVASSVAAADLSESKGFRKAVTVAGIREHQFALQGIATAAGGNRLAGTSGHDASAVYVHDKMVAAGYDVSYQEFEFLLVSDRTPPVFERTTAPAASYVDGVDFGTMTYSGSGDHTAALWAVDLLLPPVGGSTSGCEAADFAGFPAGAIALMQRGTCTFRAKADNAFTAGASGVVIFNEGNTPERSGVLFGTLSPPATVAPGSVIGTTFSLGQSLANGVTTGATGITVHLKTDTIAETRTTRNVIAETPTGDPTHVVVVGAHLDSVSRGPGINDDGSGTGVDLEIAETYAAQGRIPNTRNKLRFIWFSGEEEGLLGSHFYVDSLSASEQDDIMAMLDFDMLGSPNFVRFVYDGDNSSFPVGPGVAAGPPGSAFIEGLFTDYFNQADLATDPTAFDGRSDYGPFIAVGIPAGGVFAGAEGLKTTAQVTTYGGTAGIQYDPCYHLACDTYAGSGSGAGATAPGRGLIGLDQLSDATAHAVLTLARTKVDVRPTQATAALRTSGSLVVDSPGPKPPVDR
jgi:Zn-dependent M28 family amino/carboxypeptidase